MTMPATSWDVLNKASDRIWRICRADNPDAFKNTFNQFAIQIFNRNKKAKIIFIIKK